MSTLASVFGYGLLSARAAASVAGRFYYATDTTLMYRDNGSTWDTLSVGTGSMSTDALWDAAGDLAVGTGANTGARLAPGSSTTFLKGGTSPSWTEIAGTLLGLKVYAPNTQTIYSTSSTTLADVDATNAAVVFTAPASTNVLVRASAFCDQSSGTGDLFLGLRESTTNLAGSISRVIRTGTGQQGYVSVPMYIAGISAGSHTYKLSFCIASGGSGTARIIIQDGTVNTGWGPLIIEVWSAP